MKKSNSNKGKTYEEIYGVEKAKELKELRSKHFKKINTGKSPWNKNKKNIYSKETIQRMSLSSKPTLKDYKHNHPEFVKIEKPFIDIDKNIFVKCFHCCKRFIPTFNQLHERLKHIKKRKGNKNSYFYCSNKCKNASEFFNRKVDPQQKRKFKQYLAIVWRYTYKTVKFENIENIELRSQEYHLDHKYSIYDGFHNGIDPKLIAHKNNLQIINAKLNRQKNRKSSITLKELYSITHK